MKTSGAAAGPSHDAASSSHAAKGVGHQQVQLLRFFALSDLLNLSSATRHRMAVAAATEAASAHPSATSTDPSSTYAVETVVIAAIVDLIKESACATPAASTATETPFSMASSQMSRDAVSPRPRCFIPSAVEAAPWGSSCASATAAANASPLDSACSQPPSLLLPAVLTTPCGLARVDALHPALLPHLLTVLVQGASAVDEASTLRLSLPASTVEAHRMKCRCAFLQLLHLYASVVCSRHANICATVNDIAVLVTRAGPHDSLLAGEERGKTTFLDRVHEGLCDSPDQQWLGAHLRFLSAAVDCLSTLSRRAALQERRSGDAEDPAASTPCQRSPSPSSCAGESEAAEAVWSLQTSGMILSFMDVCLASDNTATYLATVDAGGATVQVDDAFVGKSKDEERLAVTKAANDDSSRSCAMNRCAPTSVAREDSVKLPLPSCGVRHRTDGATNSTLLAAVLTQVSREMLSQVPDGGDGRLHGEHELPESVNAGPTQAERLKKLFQVVFAECAMRPLCMEGERFPPEEQLGVSSAPQNIRCDLRQHVMALLAHHLEEQQRQQHRLLAAAERAVQRVLRLPNMPWQSPSMLVALCHVASYQLQTQLQQRQQRWGELIAEHNAMPRGTAIATGVEPSPLPCTSDACPTATAAFLGDVVWSDEEYAEDAPKDARMQTTPSPTEHALSHPPVASVPATSSLPVHAAAAALTVSALQACSALEPPSSPLRRLPINCLYTPRASSLGRLTGAKEGEKDEAGDTHLLDPLAALSDPVRYYSPTRSMEHLWELPTRVPRQWTPALATVMACCALCVPPTSTLASRLSLLTGEVPVEMADAPHDAPSPLPSAFSAQSSARASPRSSQLEFGFVRRKDAAAELRQRSSPRTSTGETEVVGALAQWHLRGLLQQLCVPSSAVMDQCVRGTGEGSVSNKASTKTNAKGASALPTGVHSSMTVPSSAGATGGASWFAAYSHANKSTTAHTPGLREGSPSPSSSSAQGLAVSRQLNAVAILASAFALHHLLRTQDRFFIWAQLGGSTLRELRLGVMGVRRLGGGPMGNVAGMLQCTPAPLSAPSGRRTSSGFCVSGSRSEGTMLQQQSVRWRSLWGEVAGVAGGDRSATAILDALLLAEDPLEERAAEREEDSAGSGVSGNGKAAMPQSSREGSPAVKATAATSAPAKGGGDVSVPPSASTCALTEALLVAVSFLGSRALAVALPHWQEDTDRGDQSGAAAPAGPSEVQQQWLDALQALTAVLLDAHRAHRCRCRLQQQQQKQSRAASAAAAAAVDVRGEARWEQGERVSPSSLTSAWRHGSLGSTREGSVMSGGGGVGADVAAVGSAWASSSYSGPAPSPSPAQLPSEVQTLVAQPPSLSIETQFGIGTLFLAVVRGLLQLHDRYKNEGDAKLYQCHAIRLSVVQCLFAVASIIDEILHDYVHCPPTALCDVLSTMSALQLPGSPGVNVTDEMAGRSSVTLWEALRATPYWDSVRLGSLESASLAWQAAAPVNNAKAAFASPRESLLGYLPCSRDPSEALWLPSSLYLSLQETLQQGIVDHANNPVNLLGRLAVEESLTLAAQDVSGEGGRMSDTLNPQQQPMAHRDGDDGEVRQLAMAVASSRRYAWWVSRLGCAWGDASLERNAS